MRIVEGFNPLPPSKRGETRCMALDTYVSVMFQSAPPVETRGDMSIPVCPRRCFQFQSAPPVETRGDLRHQVRHVIVGQFQSAPPVETRGDQHGIVFNAYVFVVSIRSPRRNEGRPVLHDGSVGEYCVSIRSPRRNEGRQYRLVDNRAGEMFQSAPPVETRGDSRRPTTKQSSCCFNPLPPSKRGETPP